MSSLDSLTWLLLAVASLLPLVTAQSTSSITRAPSATSPSSSTGTTTHTISVGHKSDPHQYVPNSVNASVGDTVLFEFYPTNHSVVKADYDAPCVPADKGLFNSGHKLADGQLTGDPPTWSLVVNDTQPVFFYCTAIDSCNVNGMVGVINPNATMTWKHQNEKAKKQPYQLEPGQAVPPEGGGGTSTTTATSSPGGSSGGGGHHLSAGAIAGIVIGSVAFVAVLLALFFVLGRNQVYKKWWMSSTDGRTERTAHWALFSNHGERKSEYGSPQPPGDQATYLSSPDPTQNTFSSPQSQYGWDATVYQPQQQQSPLVRGGPTELEAPDSLAPRH
ncbi:hypothetical protein BDV25DRAFT_135620 [Aspergillus avenaceus]|uniref:Cupredoxin n=1 Tax=Aspergillus avenaceus TaxID=36643 RepID=A0A5N6U7Z2_ASPAV|nr:hypothetical protein BDV25DRAFT_135620 [Aspergillus avenaceus]